MRRPGLLLAGMFLATGAALALASPASAAVGNSGADSPRRYHCHSQNHWHNGNGNWHNGNGWSAGRDDRDGHRRWCHSHRYRGQGHSHIYVGVGNGGVSVGVGHND